MPAVSRNKADKGETDREKATGSSAVAPLLVVNQFPRVNLFKRRVEDKIASLTFNFTNIHPFTLILGFLEGGDGW